MTKKRRTGRKAELVNLEMALSLNGQAIQEGPKRKTWSMHDLKVIKPLTPTQEEMFHAWVNYEHLCGHGSAGTGKTFLAMYLALNEVLSKNQSKIIIVRSAVPTRDIGFLPGTADEKMQHYEEPYRDILWELMGRASTYQDMKDAGLIEFQSTSFLRGLTWDNAIVIFDECQNATFEEIHTVMTRVGENTRIILAGDTKQDDLQFKRNDTSGLAKTLQILDDMKNVGKIMFTYNDIVRSKFVKEWIIACEHAA